MIRICSLLHGNVGRYENINVDRVAEWDTLDWDSVGSDGAWLGRPLS